MQAFFDSNGTIIVQAKFNSQYLYNNLLI
ncbi:hypothetical protein NTGZN8_110017 [Candidatus Nitrotoga fabula]|uniref:Uncharacterized protein n=1 Tax=Candidatus Nitrotoga fabula TaxID=2182327 RepID=A0A916BAJ1_9PROT|nr:hypothetical protein NTGZN8_110017 [Candidatus Nitrotoga fabula]